MQLVEFLLKDEDSEAAKHVLGGDVRRTYVNADMIISITGTTRDRRAGDSGAYVRLSDGSAIAIANSVTDAIVRVRGATGSIDHLDEETSD